MKKMYERIVCEIVVLDTEDVIMASGLGEGGQEDDDIGGIAFN